MSNPFNIFKQESELRHVIRDLAQGYPKIAELDAYEE